MIKKVLRTVGIVALFIGVALGALVSFAFYANHAAEKAAMVFAGAFE